ncbi:MAG TPA: family 43 glycosylhydrolase [Lachnospiraceae bacterium]|nr:family 43 glycosylhydrolase [Lachnospiraceae bacterium]
MKKYTVICYTRLPLEDAVYSEKLAFSMHLAIKKEEEDVISLNHNAGVLYVKATQNEDGTLNAKSMKNPFLFTMKDGNFGVIAVRIEPDGNGDESSRGKVLLFTSNDLLQYEEHTLLELPEIDLIDDVCCSYIEETQVYNICWKNKEGNIYAIEQKDLFVLDKKANKKKLEQLQIKPYKLVLEGAVSRNAIQVSEKIGNRIVCKLTVPENIANVVPESIIASKQKDVMEIRAKAIYSDGSEVMKPVDWNTESINWNKAGTYEISGRVHQDHYAFPISTDRADPCVGKWNGKYYFIATNDADANHTLYMRESDTILGLVNAEERLILDSSTYPHVGNLLWAPEFHVIKGRLYIFHAATPGEFMEEQSHVMTLRVNGDPMNRRDWSEPIKVVKKDGTALYTKGITLDMTEFEVDGKYYVMWSQRQFVSVDQGAWIYIAEINPNEPWKLISDPILISMPEYGWANNHTFVDEGPFALIRGKKVFVTFSSAAVDSTYTVGLLSANIGDDLLNPQVWQKCNYPLMSSRTKEGEYGTGHNAYVQDDDGLVWNTYHAKPGIDAPRSSGIRRVHFDVEGYPILEMTEELDLKPELAHVSMKVRNVMTSLPK